MTNDSLKNCTRIVRRRAPTASLTPISRVRSSTTTLMIEATPTPPTRSVNEPMTPRKIVKARKKVVNCFSNSSVSQTPRASGSAGEKPMILDRWTLMASMTALLRPRSRGRKMMLETNFVP